MPKNWLGGGNNRVPRMKTKKKKGRTKRAEKKVTTRETRASVLRTLAREKGNLNVPALGGGKGTHLKKKKGTGGGLAGSLGDEGGGFGGTENYSRDTIRGKKNTYKFLGRGSMCLGWKGHFGSRGFYVAMGERAGVKVLPLEALQGSQELTQSKQNQKADPMKGTSICYKKRMVDAEKKKCENSRSGREKMFPFLRGGVWGRRRYFETVNEAKKRQATPAGERVHVQRERACKFVKRWGQRWKRRPWFLDTL